MYMHAHCTCTHMQLAAAVAREAPALLKHWVDAMALGGAPAAASPAGRRAAAIVFHMAKAISTISMFSYDRREAAMATGARTAACIRWRDALLAAPQDIARLLLGVAASDGSSARTRVLAFAALTGLADSTAPALRERLWASEALPAVFELALNETIAHNGANCAIGQVSSGGTGSSGGGGSGGGSGDSSMAAGSDNRRTYSVYTAVVFTYVMSNGKTARLGELFVGWLNVAPHRRQPALNRLLEVMLAKGDNRQR